MESNPVWVHGSSKTSSNNLHMRKMIINNERVVGDRFMQPEVLGCLAYLPKQQCHYLTPRCGEQP